MGPAVSKDGPLTKLVESVPGGGVITAPFHSAAGNHDHARNAFTQGAANLAGTVRGNPAGAKVLGASVIYGKVKDSMCKD